MGDTTKADIIFWILAVIVIGMVTYGLIGFFNPPTPAECTSIFHKCIEEGFVLCDRTYNSCIESGWR